VRHFLLESKSEALHAAKALLRRRGDRAALVFRVALLGFPLGTAAVDRCRPETTHLGSSHLFFHSRIISYDGIVVQRILGYVGK